MGFYEKKIDKDVPSPLYYQLKMIIQEVIQSGELKPGDMLPTEKDFSELYHISRTTIRQAITELVADGFLYRIKSKGTFVSKPKIEKRNLQRIDVRHESIKDQHIIPTTKVSSLEKIPADSDVAKNLELQMGEEIIKLEMIRLADNEPFFYQISYLPKACFDIVHFDVEKKGMNEFLYSTEETRPAHSIRRLEAILANRKLSERLEIPKFSAVQMIRTVSKNKWSKPVEYTITYFRGDRSVCVIELS